VATHTLQDNYGGVMLTIGIETGLISLLGVNLEAPQDAAKVQGLMKALTPLAMTLEALAINIINIPILIFALFKSGTWERGVVRDELADEVGAVITPQEYQGVLAEQRFRLRRIAGYPRRRAGQIRNTQNSLAFHKHYLQRNGRAVDGDPLTQYWRDEVVRLRSGAGSAATAGLQATNTR
jgi:hypothetical protein